MKVENYSKLEEEIVGLKMKLDKMNHKINSYHKLEATTPKLDEILKKKKIPKINFGLGFSKGGSSKAVKIYYE